MKKNRFFKIIIQKILKWLSNKKNFKMILKELKIFFVIMKIKIMKCVIF